MPLSSDTVAHLPAVARATHGFVGADLMELAREAGLSALRRTTPILDDHRGAFRIGNDLDVTIIPADFDEALTRIRPSALREAFVRFPEVAWDDVGGLEAVKRRLRNLVERPLRDPGVFRAMGAEAPRGILLAGPPGTGKTMLVHALARSSNANFVAIDGPEIFSKWLGESEEAIRQVFRVARQLAPTIVFFDQIDALAPPRGSDLGSKTTERVVNQLLAELDAARAGTEIVVVAATNRPDLVDEAVLRPGRLGARIDVPLPDRDARSQIVRLLLRNAFVHVDLAVDEIAEALAEATPERSGADLASLVERAKLAALEESDFAKPVPLRAEHLRQALDGFAQRNSHGGIGGSP
jgi:transitional endoplasmic reticulum ATPase